MHLTEQRWPNRPTAREAGLITSVANSRTWTDGEWTAAVERRLEEQTDAPYAVAFNSCTSALHAALHALGCDSDTRVVTPSLTFAGTLTGARHIKARLEFCDVHPDLLTLDDVGEVTSSDIVVGVDLHGVPHQLPRGVIGGAPVLTDACQAIGTKVDGRHLGATGLHTWSFSSSKMVPAPDGGAATTDDLALAERLRELRDYGVPRTEHRSNGGVVWAGGHNWRPSELSMVMVAVRLENLSRWVHRAHEVTERLHRTFDELGLWRQHAPPGSMPAWHKVRFGPTNKDARLADVWERRLAEVGIPTHRWGRLPLHRHPVSSPNSERLPVTDATAEGTLCLGTEACPPMTWNDDEVEQVCRVVEVIAEG